MTQTEIVLKMVFDRWNTSLANCDKLLNNLTDEQLEKEVAPGKNRGIYLLGHLIAAHDHVLELLDLGNRLYPELIEPFLINPDKVSKDIPTVKTLRDYWANQYPILKERIESVRQDQWFEKHTAVSAEEFANEPHRNKLNIIITRTTHLQYHIGQLVLLK